MNLDREYIEVTLEAAKDNEGTWHPSAVRDLCETLLHLINDPISKEFADQIKLNEMSRVLGHVQAIAVSRLTDNQADEFLTDLEKSLGLVEED